MAIETLKRSASEEDDRVVVKKRALTSAINLPVAANGNEQQAVEPREEDELEQFRKAAIYRRMKHYSREHERAQSRIRDLENVKQMAEDNVFSLEGLVDEVGNTVRLLMKSDELPSEDNTQYASDNSKEQIVYLRRRLELTRRMVTTFVELAGRAQAPSSDDLFKQCQEVQVENTTLRSELKQVRTKLKDIEEQYYKCHEDLVSAQMRVDRIKSQTAVVPRVESPQTNGVKEGTPEEAKALVTSTLTDAYLESNLVKIKVLESTVEDLQQQIMTLTREAQANRLKLEARESEFVSLSEEGLERIPMYRTLVEYVSKTQHDAEELGKQLQSAREESEKLREQCSKLEFGLEERGSAEAEKWKVMAEKHRDDAKRLRATRDQQAAELLELKQKLSVRQSAFDEQQTLLQSRVDRIQNLESAVKRLTTRVAACSGDEDLYAFLSGDEGFTMEYVENLRQRLGDAESRCQALEAQFGIAGDSATNPKDAIDLQQQLIKARKRISNYEALMGSEETKALVEQLEAKEKQIRALELTNKNREQTESALYTELDRLSAAWETLDRQVGSKVFDLSAMEEKIAKFAVDKSKMDNKFYNLMRVKDAIDAEKKNLARLLDKQSKHIEILTNTDKKLTALVSSTESECGSAQQALNETRTQVNNLQKELSKARDEKDTEKNAVSDLRNMLVRQNKEVQDRSAEISRLNTQVQIVSRENKELSGRLQTSAVGSSVPAAKDSELQKELDKCMRILKCSTCNNAMRSTIITKCMHTFCKACVDARITHRQRKCPACNLAFSQSDVQQLYFQ